ncbi:MAG TPA: hypothetical protein VF274_11135 [Alphaproteobacteria bacterium]
MRQHVGGDSAAIETTQATTPTRADRHLCLLQYQGGYYETVPVAAFKVAADGGVTLYGHGSHEELDQSESLGLWVVFEDGYRQRAAIAADGDVLLVT